MKAKGDISVTLLIPADLVERADGLKERIRLHPALRLSGARRVRSTVLRMAIAEGLDAIERTLEEAEKE